MASKNTTTKLNKEATVNTEKSIFATMAKAIANMHAQNNGKAITKDFAAGCGVPENHFKSWELWVKRLYEVAAPWGIKYNDKKVSDEELQTIYKGIFPIWRQLVRVGDSEEGGYKNLFIRESDAIRICTYTVKDGKSKVGSIDVAVGLKTFRRNIECLLGKRLAQNAALTEDEYETMVKYEKAVSTIEKTKNRLEGYERDGKEYKGLRTLKAEAEANLVKMRALALSLGGSIKEAEIDQNPIMSGYLAAVTNIESQIKQAEATIKQAEETKKKTAKEYKEIMAKIKPIEEE